MASAVSSAQRQWAHQRRACGGESGRSGDARTSRLVTVPLSADPSPALKDYAHPDRLVTSDWLAGNIGRPGLSIVESDEDVLLYDTGHVPGAVKIDWHTDLNDPH